MASVKVAVRVRPFNQREIDLSSTCIVEVEEKKTTLINHKVPAGDGAENRERLKEFTFDYSYWSHKEADKHFAPQVQLYEDLGTDVVSNALQGYNACVFAYGQTGSGKTFTMMGSQNNPGLIPRICEALFSSMVEGREAGTTYKVEVSYLEIYNERVKDLLRVGVGNHTHSLKVREHPKTGPYVQDLSSHIVHQYPDIQELMVRGNSHRTTASTHMNDTSSRSHAIFTVTFIQARLQSDTPLETRSKIHLVDLAGSERADATGATGQRLKEGAHINKSLVTLGSVISSLAELAAKTSAGKNVFIPYRDSVLTWLLKDSLGGNSKTIMIATISPADVNYGETLSTLRYANRAKNIINKPTINEDQNVKIIRELREEILSLTAQLKEQQRIEGGKETGSIMETLNQKQAKERELTDQWTERWKETHTILQEQKTLGLRKAGQGVVLDSERPHLVLIDDNVLNTGVTLYHLNHATTTTIGARLSQDIRLEGGEVLEEHCTIELHDGVATLHAKPEAQCWVNSQFVDTPTRLTQGCVIVLGGSHMFRYSDPQEAARLRKEGHRSHLNLSRLSFLSRSASDLVKSYDNLPGVDHEFDKIQSESSFSRLAKTSKICETTDLCEMSTQTSLHTHSQPTSPIDNNHNDQSGRKSSLCLPLSGEKEERPESINSTPASDTFYTATSVLSPDPNDQVLSPLPLDSSNAPQSRHGDSGLAKGAYVGDNYDAAIVPTETRETEAQVDTETQMYFERDVDMSTSVYRSPRTSEAYEGDIINFEANKMPETNNKMPETNNKMPEITQSRANIDNIETPHKLNTQGASVDSDIGALIASPIPQAKDALKPQDSPAISTEATSTPVLVEDKHPLRRALFSAKNDEKILPKNEENAKNDEKILPENEENAKNDEKILPKNEENAKNVDKILTKNDEKNLKILAKSDLDKDMNLSTRTTNKDNLGVDNNGESHNNNLESEQNNIACNYEGINGARSKILESQQWHSLDEKENSALIYPEDEISKAAQVIMKLRENAQDGSVSMQEKISELEALKDHYGKLEEQLEKDNATCSASSLIKKAERPADLPLDSTLLQEDRLVLLIEREVQRRVLEEVVARENQALASRYHPRRYNRSMSASADPFTLPRALTPSEVRPYTSMSAGFEAEGEGGSRLYQSTASADDLLLTPAPLPSPAPADYDMSCGICVCIPGYEMRGAGSSAHWEYEVKIVAGTDAWTIFRRYRRFRELHLYMSKKYGSSVSDLSFPSRHLFPSLDERVVVKRRGELEVYLQQLIVLCSELEGSPLCGAAPSRSTLVRFSKFFQKGVFEISRHSTS